MYVNMKLMVTIGARTFTCPMKTKAMVIRLVKQIAATGVLLGPFYYINKRNIFKLILVSFAARVSGGSAVRNGYPSSLQVHA